VTRPPHGTDRLKWIRRAAIAAWTAWLASYALMASQLFARVIHPHFLPLVSLMLLGCAAGIAAAGLGLWRTIRGPSRRGAVGWSLAGAIPILLWAAHGTYAMSTVRTPGNRPMDYRLKLADVGAAAIADGLVRLAYPNRLVGEHTVMIYDHCADPEADVAEMDRHIDQVGKTLGRSLPTKVYWVRGGLLGIRGVSLVGTAVCSIEDPSERKAGRLSYLDRHETAHNVFHDQLPATACPPTVLYEGWAESQSGEPLHERARELLEKRGGRRLARSARQLLSPEMYGHGGWEVYFQGGLLVDFLVRRYGGEKFFELCATCRPETIADDCQRVYGADLDELDDLFWGDLRDRAYGKRQNRQKSISAELGLPESGPNDESARQEFLQRYPKEVEKLKEAYRHVRMAAVAKWEAPKRPGVASLRERRFEIVRDGDRVRLTRREDEWTSIEVATPQQCFYLAKKAGDARFETRWARVGPSAGHRSTLEEIRAVNPELGAPYQLPWIDVLERMRSPCFTVTRAVPSQEGSRRLVKVYFEYELPGDDVPYIEAGWWSFRPDDCWAFDAYEVRAKGLEPDARRAISKERQSELSVFAINQGTIRYRGKEKGIPVLESVERKFIRADKWQYTKTVRITEIQFGPASDATFDLASFDADPPAQEPHSAASAKEPKEDIFVRLTRWLVWAIWSCSAGVAISTALPLVRWRPFKRRHSA
jgi:hypothetical protein